MSQANPTPGVSPRADGRDHERYRRLLELDRTGWAWEWLKRNPDFLTAVDELSRNKHPTKSSCSYAIHRADTSTLAHWGVLFCRRIRLPSILVARPQSTRPDRRSSAHCCRPSRCLQCPVLPAPYCSAVLRRMRARSLSRRYAPSATRSHRGQRSRWPCAPALPAVGFPAHGSKGFGAATAVRAFPPRSPASWPFSAGAPRQTLGHDAARLGRRDGGCEPAAGGGSDLRGDGGARALGVRLPLPYATACPRGGGDGQRWLPETSGAGNKGKERLLTGGGLKPARERRPACNP